MRKLIPSLVICSLAVSTNVVFAKSNKHAEKAKSNHAKKSAKSKKTDASEFLNLFNEWTDAFNRKDLQGACDLFSPSLTADYQGAPTKSLTSMHDGLQKVFAEESKHYSYKYKLHDVYKSGNLAAIRVTWYLTVTEDGKSPRETIDQGLDILRKGKKGKWQIVNYIAYQDKQDQK